MKQKNSSYDRIKAHLRTRGCKRPVPAALREDLETVVRRADEVRGLGREYGGVELSPYLAALLRVSNTPDDRAGAVRVLAAVGG